MSDLGTPGAWMLISREDARKIAAALDRIAANANVSVVAQADACDALHALNSGLHATDEVPDDWRPSFVTYRPPRTTAG